MSQDERTAAALQDLRAAQALLDRALKALSEPAPAAAPGEPKGKRPTLLGSNVHPE